MNTATNLAEALDGDQHGCADETQRLRAALERWFSLPHTAPPHEWVRAERLVREACEKKWPDFKGRFVDATA